MRYIRLSLLVIGLVTCFSGEIQATLIEGNIETSYSRWRNPGAHAYKGNFERAIELFVGRRAINVVEGAALLLNLQARSHCWRREIEPGDRFLMTYTVNGVDRVAYIEVDENTFPPGVPRGMWVCVADGVGPAIALPDICENISVIWITPGGAFVPASPSPYGIPAGPPPGFIPGGGRRNSEGGPPGFSPFGFGGLGGGGGFIPFILPTGGNRPLVQREGAFPPIGQLPSIPFVEAVPSSPEIRVPIIPITPIVIPSEVPLVPIVPETGPHLPVVLPETPQIPETPKVPEVPVPEPPTQNLLIVGIILLLLIVRSTPKTRNAGR